jgi:short subunit dehydrogenase-like uncharacterized protein
VTIVLYGATGYTGRLVTRELVRRGLEFTLAGRNPEKLARLSEELGQGAPVAAASVDDDAALRELLSGASVVINCAGPFTLAGDAVVRAALATGTHYVDSTGEQSYIRMVFDHHGTAAERAGVALVPAMGFDYVPGDLIARLTARRREPLEELVLAYSVRGFGASRGTLRSTLEILKGGHLVYEDGDWRPAPGGIFRASFDFGPPIGKQSMTRYPSGEVITVPRHTRTRRVTSLLSLRTAAPHPALVPALPFLMPGLELALRTPLRDALGRAIGALPEGPPEGARRAAQFTIVAVARGEDGSSRRGVVRGSDPYGLTAVTLVYGAERMASDDYDRAGALGPAAAYDPEDFLEYLGDHGVTWELERDPVPA